VSSYLTTGRAKIIGIGREVVGRRKNGSHFPMELAISEFRIGSERYFTGIVRDITERKRLENELHQKLEQLAVADQRKDQFIGLLGTSCAIRSRRSAMACRSFGTRRVRRTR
jgi:hypothetical protein